MRLFKFRECEKGAVAAELGGMLKIALFVLPVFSGILSERTNWAFDEVAFFIHGGTRETYETAASTEGAGAGCNGACTDQLIELSTSPPIITLVP